MLNKGIDAGLIRTYIENSATISYPTPDEIIHLRQSGASPEVIAALIRRGAELREQRIKAYKESQAKLAATQNSPAVITSTAQQPQYATAPVINYAPSFPTYVYPNYYPAYAYNYSYWPVVYPFFYSGHFRRFRPFFHARIHRPFHFHHRPSHFHHRSIPVAVGGSRAAFSPVPGVGMGRPGGHHRFH
jgi:hypothetical protein